MSETLTADTVDLDQSHQFGRKGRTKVHSRTDVAQEGKTSLRRSSPDCVLGAELEIGEPLPTPPSPSETLLAESVKAKKTQ